MLCWAVYNNIPNGCSIDCAPTPHTPTSSNSWQPIKNGTKIILSKQSKQKGKLYQSQGYLNLFFDTAVI